MVKHEQTRWDILEWFLQHSMKEGMHKCSILHFVNNNFRYLTKEEVADFIHFMLSSRASEQLEKYPWGDPELGQGKPRGLC
jgi:hypothetical protein